MVYANDVVNMALSQVGITEFPPNSNKVKYNTDYYGKPIGGSAYPWCCVFVWWIFNQFNPLLVKKTASSSDLARWFKQNNQWFTAPMVGDVVFFNWGRKDVLAEHVGIVVGIEGNKIITVEGNTAIGNEDNGGKVMKRTRVGNIVGYGRPKYDVSDSYQHGVDVSSYQGAIDWKKVKDAGIQFAVLRSTAKGNKVDSSFERNLAGCIENRIDYSCYKYSYAMTPEEAKEEAQSVIRLLHGRRMMIWLDLEDSTQKKLTKQELEQVAFAFIDTCALAGYSVGIYCNADWYRTRIPDSLKRNYLFWVARYGKNNGSPDETYKPTWPEVFAWQYTSKGSVAGIKGNVDCDVIVK